MFADLLFSLYAYYSLVALHFADEVSCVYVFLVVWVFTYYYFIYLHISRLARHVFLYLCVYVSVLLCFTLFAFSCF